MITIRRGNPGATGEPRIYACSWTLLPLMGTIEAARFWAEHGLAGLKINCPPAAANDNRSAMCYLASRMYRVPYRAR